MREQFLQWAKDFDTELSEENLRLFRDGEMGLQKVEIKIMGQLGLLLGITEIGLNATSDLDAVIRGDVIVKQLFRTFLLRHNLVLDDDAELIQMPQGTKWEKFFDGKFVKITVADPLSIVRSKCQFKRLKDKAQLNKIFQQFPKWKRAVVEGGIGLEWLDE